MDIKIIVLLIISIEIFDCIFAKRINKKEQKLVELKIQITNFTDGPEIIGIGIYYKNYIFEKHF